MKQFRPYQESGLGAVLRVVEKCERKALLVMATGLGKSVIAARFARTMWNILGWRTLYVMHMVDPLKKMQGDHFSEEFEGTEATFGMYAGRNVQNVSDADVVFATFDKMYSNLDLFDSDEFNLIIVDECHHAYAPTYKKVIDHFTPDFIFGMTATPDRMDGLDIRDIFGPEMYEYLLLKALTDGQKWLADVDYRVMLDNINGKKLTELLRELRQKKGIRITKSDLDRTLFLKEKLEASAARIREVQQDGDKQTIIFCRSIQHMEEVSAYFPEFKEYHSGIARGVLERRFARFEAGKIRGLLVVDMFNEAVDVPEAELLVFLRSTESRRIWEQHLGRGLRRTPNKDRVMVLDFVANCDRIAMISDVTRRLLQSSKRTLRPVETVETGWSVNFDEDVRDIIEILDWFQENSRFYETIEEAMESVRRLGIQTPADYKSRYKEDPQLPSHPEFNYADDWVSCPIS